MIGLKIAYSGLVLALLLLIPGMLRGKSPPDWFKVVVLSVGGIGVVLLFVGMLMAIWQ